MTICLLSSLVQELRAELLRLPPLPAGAPLAQMATGLAARVHSAPTVAQLPELINVGALAIAMRERLVVHEIREPVPEFVAATDLHTLPDEPPRLLRAPWICEVRDPERERLFGDTVSLAGYQHEGRVCLIGLGYPDGCRVAWWSPAWSGGDLDEGTEHDVLLDVDRDDHYAWTRAAARFAVVLGLLLDAAGTPLSWADEGPQVARRVHGERRPARPWAVRRVYLDGGVVAREGRDGAGGDAEEGRMLAEVPVRGHLRRQPCGPGGRERRWIYVAEHSARRWVAARPTITSVGVGGRWRWN